MRIVGPVVSSYEVADKHFTFEDSDNAPPHYSTLCPLCHQDDSHRLALLCDGCMVYYHADCVGLDNVPEFTWFCYSCQRSAPRNRPLPYGDQYESVDEEDDDDESRTQNSTRLRRLQARYDDWARAWESVWTEQEEDEYEDRRRGSGRWNRRAAIAQAQGVLGIFHDTFPYLLQSSRQREVSSEEPPEETEEEKNAWKAMEEFAQMEEMEKQVGESSKAAEEAARQAEAEASREEEPKRSYKRPRTKRDSEFGHPPPEKRPKVDEIVTDNGQPSVFKSLLDQVERARSPVLSVGTIEAASPRHYDYTSDSGPASPASTVGWHTHQNRATSATPPSSRSRSPDSASPMYSPNYANSPTASGRISPNYTTAASTHHVPQSPTPTGPHRVTGLQLPLETKQEIQSIVRGFLKPHYRAGLSAEKFMEINRHVSRKLYELVPELGTPQAENDEVIRKWHERAKSEVGKALAVETMK